MSNFSLDKLPYIYYNVHATMEYFRDFAESKKEKIPLHLHERENDFSGGCFGIFKGEPLLV